MKRKVLISILVIFSLLIFTGCSLKDINSENTKIKSKEEIDVSNEEVSFVKVIINEKEYVIDLEDNDTAQKLAEIIPFEVTMTELNGYEKYVYLGTNFPIHQYQPGHIEKGDVMLFDSSCIVIFYKSVELPFNYTKIGHIDNLDDLGSENVVANFE